MGTHLQMFPDLPSSWTGSVSFIHIVSAMRSEKIFAALMNYDVWGSWSPTAGPNAPLYDSCAPVQGGSAQSAVTAWTAAKFPAKQVNDSSPDIAYMLMFSDCSRCALVLTQFLRCFKRSDCQQCPCALPTIRQVLSAPRSG